MLGGWIKLKKITAMSYICNDYSRIKKFSDKIDLLIILHSMMKMIRSNLFHIQKPISETLKKNETQIIIDKTVVFYCINHLM